MRQTIDKPGLAKALAHVASVVERRNTIPILSNVQIEADSGEVSLTATRQSVTVGEQFTVAVEVRHDGVGSVPKPELPAVENLRTVSGRASSGPKIPVTLAPACHCVES